MSDDGIPIASPKSLSLIDVPDDALALIADLCPSLQDAYRLAASFKRARAIVRGRSMWPVVDLMLNNQASLILEPPSGRFHAVLTPEAAAARVPPGGSVLLAPGLFSLPALQALLDGGACVFGRGQARVEGSSSLRIREETPKAVLDGIAVTSRVDSPSSLNSAYAELAIGLKRGENYHRYTTAMADHAALHLARSLTKTRLQNLDLASDGLCAVYVDAPSRAVLSNCRLTVLRAGVPAFAIIMQGEIEDGGFHWADCAVLLHNVEFGQPPQPAPGGPAPPCKPLLYLFEGEWSGPGVNLADICKLSGTTNGDYDQIMEKMEGDPEEEDEYGFDEFGDEFGDFGDGPEELG